MSENRLPGSHAVQQAIASTSFEGICALTSRDPPPDHPARDSFVAEAPAPMDLDSDAESNVELDRDHRKRLTSDPQSVLPKKMGKLDNNLVIDKSHVPHDITDNNVSNSNDNPAKKGITYENHYTPSDSPPYAVHVHSVNSDLHAALHPLHVSRIISQIAYNDVSEIRKIGRGKILVELKSASAANNLVKSPLLNAHKLRAYIPTYRTLRTGVIRDIPTDISEEIIKKYIESPFKVIEVHRLNQRITRDDKSEIVPSKSICIKFAGQTLPKHVFLFCTKHVVTTYIPKVRICYRAGHISKACRSNARCISCGKAPHENAQECSLRDTSHRCINCEGGHLSTSYVCPLVIRQKKIVSLAACENTPLLSAKRRIVQESPGVSPDSRFDYDNYPTLPRVRDEDPQEYPVGNNRFAVLNTIPVNSSANFDHTYANVMTAGKRRLYHNNKNSSAPTQSRFEARVTHNLDNSLDPREDILINRNGRLPSDSPNGLAYAHNPYLHASRHMSQDPDSTFPPPPPIPSSSYLPNVILENPLLKNLDISSLIQLLLLTLQHLGSFTSFNKLPSSSTHASESNKIHVS